MGYDTQFSGQIKIPDNTNFKQLRLLKKYLGVNLRRAGIPKELQKQAEGLTYIDLELNWDDSALEWDGSEDTSDLDKKIDFLTDLMRLEDPGFKFSGTLEAQGEEIGDCWTLVIKDDGYTEIIERPLIGDIVTCPECEHQFTL